jgi:hypothetical protein
MADKSGDLEADAIDHAFQEKIGDLFKTLVRGLMEGLISEQKSVEGFANGIKYTRRARELALDAKAEPEASAKTKGKTAKVKPDRLIRTPAHPTTGNNRACRSIPCS